MARPKLTNYYWWKWEEKYPVAMLIVNSLIMLLLMGLVAYCYYLLIKIWHPIFILVLIVLTPLPFAYIINILHCVRCIRGERDYFYDEDGLD